LTRQGVDGPARLRDRFQIGGQASRFGSTSQIWIETGIIPAANWSDILKVCEAVLGHWEGGEKDTKVQRRWQMNPRTTASALCHWRRRKSRYGRNGSDVTLKSESGDPGRHEQYSDTAALIDVINGVSGA